MFKLWQRLALSAAMLLTLLAFLAPYAVAWTISCNDTNGVCVYIDDNFAGHKATTNLSDAQYSGDNYPNTGVSINNTVSSVINAFTPSWKDIYFADIAPGGTGDAMCLNALDEDPDLGAFGFGMDDKISHHQVMTTNLCS